MKFALRYIEQSGQWRRTAWQDTIAQMRNIADFLENKGYTVVSFIYQENPPNQNVGA